MDFLMFLVPVNNARSTEVLPILKATIKELAGPDISDEDFERARGDALGGLARIDDQPSQLAPLLSSTGRVAYLDPEVVAFLKRMPKADYLRLAAPWLAEDASVNFLFGRSRARKAAPHRAEAETP